VRELDIVGSITEALNSSPSVEEALQRTLGLVTKLLGLETGWVWLVDPETHHIYSAAARNLPPYLQEPVRMSGESWCWCLQAFRDGTLTPQNIDVIECSRLKPAVKNRKNDLTRGLAHHASVPLSFQGKPLGVMNITAPAMRKVTKRELRLLSTIGLQVGIAIERWRLAEESASLARADERARLAREIHDTIAQGLVALALQIETALRSVETDPERMRERLRFALATTRANLDEARRSVTDLRATAGKPLAQAIAALAREVMAESGVHVTFETKGRCALDSSVEKELYRIAQQAMTNVLQHANAKNIFISLACSRSKTTLTIEDDGDGFDPKRVPEDRHGVRGMRERAESVGGVLRIRSKRGGTKITAVVPA
jgi:two-component system, NarL family, sensor kinase